jgi:hypothetical protein
MDIRWRILGIIFACILFLWGVPYANCEIITLFHGNEFAEVYKWNAMLGEQAYLKVLEYSRSSARVYYVNESHTDANVLKFTKEHGEWICSSWDTAWAISGTADKIVWPYWWHFFYSHPILALLRQ